MWLWPNNQLTKILQIKYPLIQAPMAGGATTPELVAAVSNNGGLGSLGAAYLNPDQLRTTIQKIRSLTNKPFGVNLFIPAPPLPPDTAAKVAQMQELIRPYREELGLTPYAESILHEISFEEQLEVILAENVPVFSFTFGIISPECLAKLKANGTLVMGTATTVREAVALEEAGVDAIVGQGGEAGGHRGTFQVPAEKALIGTMALIPQIVDRVKLPVVAAGGIMDGRGVVAALALGAVGASIGTAFLTTTESGIHPDYKAAILASSEEDTFITKAFSGKSARGLRNRFGEELATHQNDIPAFPVQIGLVGEMRQAASKQNKMECMSLWAGQATRLNRAHSAAELMTELIQDVEKILFSR